MADLAKKQKWWHIKWFSDDDTSEDRRFITKLDLMIVPYLVVSYWVKNLDQYNLNNAYISGMEEDLGFYGNQLIQLQTIYIVGAVLGQIPFLFIFTYYPMYYLLPGMDIMWSIFTLLQYRAAGYAEMMAYRFMIGWFEAAYFPAVHYVLGSWYRRYEISRRGGIWYIGLPIGTLTAGLVQAGATARLDGVHGLAGWRWMYIICAIISLPVGIIGFFLIPGTVDQPNRLILSSKDIETARCRLQRHGHTVQGKLKWNHIKEIFASKYFYLAVLVDVLFWNHGANTSGFLLWLKSLDKYSTEKVNQYGTLPSVLGIFYTLFINFSSDLLWGPHWGITFAATANAIALLILVGRKSACLSGFGPYVDEQTVWNVPNAALWWAFCSTSWSYALSSSLYGWVNNILRDSPETRSFTLVFINIISQSSTAWTGILAYPTVDAPRFRKGYPFSLACAVSLIVFTHLLKHVLGKREQKQQFVEPISEENLIVGDVEQSSAKIIAMTATSICK